MYLLRLFGARVGKGVVIKPKVNINIKNLFAGNQDDDTENDDPHIIDITDDSGNDATVVALKDVVKQDVNSPLDIVVWGGTQAQHDSQFPSGAPSNYLSLLTDATAPTITASNIVNTPTNGLTATDVQAAIDELKALIDANGITTGGAFTGVFDNTSEVVSNYFGGIPQLGPEKRMVLQIIARYNLALQIEYCLRTKDSCNVNCEY